MLLLLSYWEKTDAIMTDSVSKNLKIEDLIGESLDSGHLIYEREGVPLSLKEICQVGQICSSIG